MPQTPTPGSGTTRRAAGLALTMVVALVAAGCSVGQVTPAPSPSRAIPIASPITAPPSEATQSTPPATAEPSAGPTPVASPTEFAPVQISLHSVIGGLPSPIGVSIAPGDPRLFVIGQAGQIVIVSGGKVAGTFLDISARMSCCGERGLLGLAFHPDYPINGRFFVRYTDPAGDIRVSEFRVGTDPNKADPTSEKILLTIPHPSFANHNGGRIVFGPDGYLYVGTGDGGSGGDPNNHGQNLGTLLGKMVRIDVDQRDGTLPYAVPPSNPFIEQSGKLSQIFAYGLRNPYSFSFDRLTGDLWIGDVGQDQWEEVDRALASERGGNGVNFGWSVMEGNHCYKPSTACNPAGMARPLAEYDHGTNDSNGCAIIGGYVYRGTAHPELYGRYFFGDECSGKIWDVAAAGPASQTPQLLLASGLNVVGWGEDVAGELYVVASNGTLYQLA